MLSFLVCRLMHDDTIICTIDIVIGCEAFSSVIEMVLLMHYVNR